MYPGNPLSNCSLVKSVLSHLLHVHCAIEPVLALPTETPFKVVAIARGVLHQYPCTRSSTLVTTLPSGTGSWNERWPLFQLPDGAEHA
jgi:hypothetical protein